jgi:membrane-bound inhibitor of C-type lysozyme
VTRVRRIAAILSSAALSGCGAGSRQAPSEHVFACADGSRVGATYARDRMTLRLPSGMATLPIARSASGARYANDTLEFWEHAGEARISRAGIVVLDHCRPTG